MTAKTCTGPNCTNTSRRRSGLCDGHHLQALRGQSLKPLSARRKRGARLERDEQGRKQCGRCDTWTNPEGFATDNRAADGLSSWCRRCAHLSQFNILPQTYDAMLDRQGGVCRTCKQEPADGQPLHVDHDHRCCPKAGKSCGKCVRGLLCRACNTALGLVRDNPGTLRALADYLEGHDDA